MKPIALSIAAVALLAAMLPAHAQRAYPEGAAPAAPLATTDPLVRLYRISGVRDNGAGADGGVATSFHCSSFSTVDEKLRITLRNFNHTQVANRTVTIHPLDTVTLSTHFARIFTEDLQLSPGVNINQGSAEIFATSVDIVCSAMIIDAAVAFPDGVALHMVRFNAAPGTQE
jgi:hypothetical protein